MSRDMSETLKPCPFCGGKARIYQSPNATALWRAACENCDAGPHSYVGYKVTAERWNRRPAALAAEQALAQAREALELTQAWFADGSWIPTVSGSYCRVGEIGPRTKAVQAAVHDTCAALRTLPSEPVNASKDGGAK